MVHDPRKGDNQGGKAGSFLFFIVAILVLAVSAALELLQHLPPLQVRSNMLLLLLLAALILLAYRLQKMLR